MKVEQFFNDIPVDRLAQELTGKEVAIEVLIVDNCAEHLASGEGRYLERFPSRQPTTEEIRDFVALHYTPLLQVWNNGYCGLAERPTSAVEDVFDPAVRIVCLTTRITGFKRLQVPRDMPPELELVEIENTSGVSLSFPLHQLEERVLSMTITVNPFTHRREYAIRFYNTVLVISLPES